MMHGRCCSKVAVRRQRGQLQVNSRYPPYLYGRECQDQTLCGAALWALG